MTMMTVFSKTLTKYFLRRMIWQLFFLIKLYNTFFSCAVVDALSFCLPTN